MPIIINLLISAGVIWALIIIFNEGGSLKYMQQQAFIIVGWVGLTGFVAAFLLPPSIALLVPVAQAAALYLAVEKICDFSRASAARVTVWYFVIIFRITVGIELFCW